MTRAKSLEKMQRRLDRQAQVAKYKSTIKSLLGRNPSSDDYKAAMDATGLSMIAVCKINRLGRYD